MSVHSSEAEPKPLRGTMAPMLPLALLESIRAHDKPREVLEDENLSASLPRRLGLTDVVESRIQAYERASRQDRGIPAEEVADLLRLVLRRPDAEAILRDAGTRVAGRCFRRATATIAVRALPGAFRRAAAARAVRRMLRRTVGAGRLRVSRRPFHVRVTGAPTAGLDPAGVACVLYTAAIEELYFLYTRERPTVRHGSCAAQGESGCEWELGS